MNSCLGPVRRKLQWVNMEKPVLKKKKKKNKNSCKPLEEKPPCNTKLGARQSPEGHRQAVDHLGCSGTPTVQMMLPVEGGLRGGSEAGEDVLP